MPSIDELTPNLTYPTRGCALNTLRLRLYKRLFLLTLICPCALTVTPDIHAQDAAPTASQQQTLAAQKPLIVGTKTAPPFAMQDQSGRWEGFSIALWQAIAEKLGRETEFRSYETSDQLITAAQNGEVDAAIAALSLTAEREKVVDFSHPYYRSGFAIAVSNTHSSEFWVILKALVSPAFLTTVGMLGGLLLLTGALMWLIERKRNWDQFDRKPVSGVADGVWWSAVTMTTVGYGDKAPVTALGRFVAMIWMFAALILTALFTAQLASSLTASQISGPVKSVKDLPNVRVGTVEQSATKEYFAKRLIRSREMANINEGLNAIDNGEIDAFVHDEPIIRYEILKTYQDKIRTLPSILEPHDYAIVMPPNSPNREAINQALLDVMDTADWRNAYLKYFGDGKLH